MTLPTCVTSQPVYLMSPLRLFALVLAIIFVVEILIMLLFRLWLPPGMSPWAEALLDGSLLTGISAPLLFWLIARPLQHTAVTERTKSTTIVNAAPDGIITTDERGLIESFNPAAERLFDYRADEAVGQNVSMLMLEFDGDRHDDHIRRYLRTGRGKVIGIGPREEMARRKDGAAFPMDLALNEMILDGGRKFVAIVRDITSRKLAEIELRRAKEAAEAADQAKSEFMANMSHELRTPMNAIIGYTGLMLDMELDEEQRYLLETIQNSGQALLAIINDILDFSRIEAGTMRLESQPFNLHDCIINVVMANVADAREKGLQLMQTIEKSVPKQIVGDDGRLQQVLNKLLSNAIKFTHEGAVMVTVDGRPLDDDWVEIHFAVSDTGIGIPAKGMGRLFHPFSQVDGSLTREYGGVGLGLTISRQFVELADGQMWLESEIGQGSTFHFTLPARRVDRHKTGEGRPSAFPRLDS